MKTRAECVAEAAEQFGYKHVDVRVGRTRYDNTAGTAVPKMEYKPTGFVGYKVMDHTCKDGEWTPTKYVCLPDHVVSLPDARVSGSLPAIDTVMWALMASRYLTHPHPTTKHGYRTLRQFIQRTEPVMSIGGDGYDKLSWFRDKGDVHIQFRLVPANELVRWTDDERLAVPSISDMLDRGAKQWLHNRGINL